MITIKDSADIVAKMKQSSIAYSVNSRTGFVVSPNKPVDVSRFPQLVWEKQFNGPFRTRIPAFKIDR